MNTSQESTSVPTPTSFDASAFFGTPDLVSPVAMAEMLDQEEESAHEEKRLARRAVYIANCGEYTYRMNPASGKFYSYQIRCGYWRECERCRALRQGEFEARFDRCVNEVEGEEFLGVVETSGKEASKIVRKLNRKGSKKWRMPVEGGSVVILFDAYHFPELGNRSLKTLDWERLSATPKGRRYTGKLGRLEKEEKKEGIVVTVPQFVFDVPLEVNPLKIWSIAKKETNYLDPGYDVEDIELCCYERMERFVELMTGAGAVVLDKMGVQVRVPMDGFGWNKNKRIETKRPSGGVGDVKVVQVGSLDAQFDTERTIEELWIT